MLLKVLPVFKGLGLVLNDPLVDDLALHRDILDVFNFINRNILSDWYHARPDYLLTSPLHA